MFAVECFQPQALLNRPLQYLRSGNSLDAIVRRRSAAQTEGGSFPGDESPGYIQFSLREILYKGRASTPLRAD
jgi:hypothetical protein